jgi:hypothetical protein
MIPTLDAKAYGKGQLENIIFTKGITVMDNALREEFKIDSRGSFSNNRQRKKIRREMCGRRIEDSFALLCKNNILMFVA